MLFAEMEGHEHVHFHVVPRMRSFGPDERGPSVFRFLNIPEKEQVPEGERERLAFRIGSAMTSALTTTS